MPRLRHAEGISPHHPLGYRYRVEVQPISSAGHTLFSAFSWVSNPCNEKQIHHRKKNPIPTQSRLGMDGNPGYFLDITKPNIKL